MRLFCAALVGMVQDRTDLPSRMTVHAPHWPRPHPNRGPCSPRLLRNTYKSGALKSASTTRTFPFTLSEICAIAVFPFLTDPADKKGTVFRIFPRNCLIQRACCRYYTRPGSDG